MKCARVNLQERPRTKSEVVPINDNKPRRYCQKRMVDPSHYEDPRWNDVIQRFHFINSFDYEDTEIQGTIPVENQEDLFLSVQNLKFQGQITERKRPKTSFKYKSLTDSKKHRMFVKQIVENIEAEDDVTSQLTSYYFDDYVKYILNNDRSRPSSSKSSLFLQGLGNKHKENKSVQEGAKQTDRKKTQNDSRDKKSTTKVEKENSKDEEKNSSNINNIEDAKIAFHKSGKRKSLTISRAPSPETVQVIRVDVVCNYSTSSILSDHYDDNKNKNRTDESKLDKKENINFKSSHFTDKYLLTNTVKTLDTNVSGGAKVTLLCKTFKLSDRSKHSLDRKNTKTIKDESKSKLRHNNMI